jgi:hypothetical protein
LLEAVFHVPDLFGDRGGKTGHGANPRPAFRWKALRMPEMSDLHNWLKPCHERLPYSGSRMGDSVGKLVHLIKLSAGTESVDTLIAWQEQFRHRFDDALPRHVTRMWPKRQEDLLNGGSIYWVIKGLIQCRQRILRLDEVDRGDGIRRCGLVLEPGLVRTTTAPKRAFQGWRYLAPEDAPPDLAADRQGEETLPPELAGALAEIGVL